MTHNVNEGCELTTNWFRFENLEGVEVAMKWHKSTVKWDFEFIAEHARKLAVKQKQDELLLTSTDVKETWDMYEGFSDPGFLLGLLGCILGTTAWGIIVYAWVRYGRKRGSPPEDFPLSPPRV